MNYHQTSPIALQTPLTGSQTPLTGSKTPLMEKLPILQDFVPYRDRCLASIEITKPVAKRHQMVSGSLALPYCFFIVSFLVI